MPAVTNNPFDQFDNAPRAAAQSNPFDQFDSHSSAPVSPEIHPSASVSAPIAMGEGAIDSLAAGVQGTSPIVGTAFGERNYQEAPSEAQAIFNESGNVQNEQTQVALRDPSTGQYKIYMRNPDMEEGTLPAIGRMLAYGIPEAGIPKVATAAEATAPQKLLQDFAQTGVSPNVPAVGQGIGSRLAANVVSKIPFFGQPIASGTKTMMGETGAAADRLASGLGPAEDAEQAGNAVQSGIGQFAKGPKPAGMTAADVISSPTRTSSFAAKSNALYDRFWSQMDPNAQIPLDNTLDALKGPMERFPTSPELGQKITNPKLSSFFQTLAPQTTETGPVYSSLLDQSGNPMLIHAAQKIDSGGSLTVPELKEFRSFIGRAMGDPQLVDNIPRADLKRVYGAMSQDLESAAKAQGLGAARAFEAANSYYSAGQSRIDQLEPLLSGSPEHTFAAINRAAGTGSSANAGVLRSLQRSLTPDDWGNVGAAVLRKMGTPTPGAADVLHGADFSPSSFVTNWSKLSDTAKDTMFGAQGTPQRDSIEALTRVAGAQKNVTKFANPSGTASHVGAAAGLAALWEGHDAILEHPIVATLSALGGYGASKLLMSPAAARWLYAMPSTINRAPNAAAGIERAIGGFDNLARSDPGLAPLAASLHANFDAPPAAQQSKVEAPIAQYADGGELPAPELDDKIERAALAAKAEQPQELADGGSADHRSLSVADQGRHFADLLEAARQRHYANGGGVRAMSVEEQGAHLADMIEKRRKEISAQDVASVPAG